ncbi:MAG: hypothetical protein K8S20_13120 [Chloroflexi bacterium]|nr:hypothetical protein [Chloroflexota bacterium]
MIAKRMIASIWLVFTLLAACAPAPISTPQPDRSNAPAIAMVEQFYTGINDAQVLNDLGRSWALLSNDAQCNSVNHCDLVYFEDRWWNSKAIYTLYDCGPNLVAAEERKYPRDADPASASGNPTYWLYQLNDYDGSLLISKMDLIQAPGPECVPVK